MARSMRGLAGGAAAVVVLGTLAASASASAAAAAPPGGSFSCTATGAESVAARIVVPFVQANPAGAPAGRPPRARPASHPAWPDRGPRRPSAPARERITDVRARACATATCRSCWTATRTPRRWCGRRRSCAAAPGCRSSRARRSCGGCASTAGAPFDVAGHARSRSPTAPRCSSTRSTSGRRDGARDPDGAPGRHAPGAAVVQLRHRRRGRDRRRLRPLTGPRATRRRRPPGPPARPPRPAPAGAPPRPRRTRR